MDVGVVFFSVIFLWKVEQMFSGRAPALKILCILNDHIACCCSLSGTAVAFFNEV
jgi:hypothetical protein